MLKTTIVLFVYLLLFSTFVTMVLEGIQGFDCRLTANQRKAIYEWSNVMLAMTMAILFVLVLLMSATYFVYRLE